MPWTVWRYPLSNGEQAGDVKALSGSMRGLKRKITLKKKGGRVPDEELSELKDVIPQLRPGKAAVR